MVDPGSMDDNDEIIIDEDKSPAPDDNPAQGKIYTQVADPTIQVLHTRYKTGKLALQPDFQRQFVWDQVKVSRLIESILLDIPLPVVYLAEESDGKSAVIDGQQRLTACFKFIDGELALTGLNALPDLNRKKYSALSEEHQNKIHDTAIRTILLKKESSKDLRFEIFERLNSGSVALNDQELRNCIYHGKYITLLRDLAGESEFMKLPYALISGEQRSSRRSDPMLHSRVSSVARLNKSYSIKIQRVLCADSISRNWMTLLSITSSNTGKAAKQFPEMRV